MESASDILSNGNLKTCALFEPMMDEVGTMDGPLCRILQPQASSCIEGSGLDAHMGATTMIGCDVTLSPNGKWTLINV